MDTTNQCFPFRWLAQSVLSSLMACVFASCSSYSKISERRPEYRPQTGTVGALANAQAEILKAMQRDRREPLAALGGYLTAAEATLRDRKSVV